MRYKSIFFSLTVFLLSQSPALTLDTPYKELIDKGEGFAKSGNWQAASEQFFKACTLEDSNALGFYDLGIAYLHLNKFAKARAAEERALDLNPNYVNAHIQLATILSNMGGQSESEAELNKALALEPNNELAKRNYENVIRIKHATRGEANKLISAITDPNKRVEKVVETPPVKKPPIETLEKPVQNPVGKPETKIALMPPGSIIIPIGKGAGEFPSDLMPLPPIEKSFTATKAAPKSDAVEDAKKAFSEGRLDTAKRLLETAINTEPKRGDLYAALGAILGTKGEIDQEITCEQKAIALNKSNAVAYMNLGWALARRSKWEDALKNYQQAASFDPHLMEAKVGVGLCQLSTEKLAAAQETLNSAVTAFPKEALPHIGLSMLFAKQGQYANSQAELQKAIDCDPENIDALEHAAAQELYNENWDKAQDLYSRVIKKYPQNSQAWLGLGLALEKSAFHQKALNSFRKAVELAPKDSVAHMALALAYESRGRIPEAELELQEALRLNPEYRVAASQVKQKLTDGPP
jgi:tetratricopeptide (TPR) repeat protein